MKNYIKEKDPDFVNLWAKNIKPLIRNDGKIFHFENKADHFNQSFPWEADPTIEAENIFELKKITTYHTYGYYGFFKPSVAEVIQQIPEELLESVKFFLVDGPETADDLNKNKKELNDGYHVAATTLFGVK